MLGGKQKNEFQAGFAKTCTTTRFCNPIELCSLCCVARLVFVLALVGSLGAPKLIIIVQNRSKLRFDKSRYEKIVKSSVSLDNMCVSRALRFQWFKLAASCGSILLILVERNENQNLCKKEPLAPRNSDMSFC